GQAAPGAAVEHAPRGRDGHRAGGGDGPVALDPRAEGHEQVEGQYGGGDRHVEAQAGGRAGPTEGEQGQGQDGADHRGQDREVLGHEARGPGGGVGGDVAAGQAEVAEQVAGGRPAVGGVPGEGGDQAEQGDRGADRERGAGRGGPVSPGREQGAGGADGQEQGRVLEEQAETDAGPEGGPVAGAAGEDGACRERDA